MKRFWSVTVLGSVAMLLVVACITGKEAQDGADTGKAVAPFVPPPYTPLATIAADKLDSAIAAYLEAHPEKQDQKLGLQDWLGIAGLGLFGGGARRKGTELIAATLKTLAAPAKVS